MSDNYGSRAQRRAQENSNLDADNQTELAEVLPVRPETDKKIEKHKEKAVSPHLRTRQSKLALRVRDREKRESENIIAASKSAYLILLALGVLFSLTFYSFPLFHQMATPLQSQYLYSGFAMQHGLTPFNDFFGAGGSLFYLLNWLGNLGGTTWILYLLQLIALVASGLLTYRLVLQQTLENSAALVIAGFTMVSVAGLGRGGDAPTLLAFPFAVWAVKFLDSYFRKESKDEKFILFGISAAAVFTISPLMSIFFLVSIIALFVYNLSHFKIGHGIYQLLAALFGLLLVGYSVAYYALNEQTIYTSIEQSVLIPFSHFGMTGNIWLTLAKAVVLILIFGLLTGFVLGLGQIKQSEGHGIWYVLLLIGAVIVTLIVVLSSTFDSSNFLAVVPFILVFQGQSLENAVLSKRNSFIAYLRNKLFAPVLAVIFVLAMPFVHANINKTTFAAERTVANYVKAHTSSKDQVYVIAGDKNINLLAKRTASVDNVPAAYPLKFQQTFDLNVAEAKDKLIIIESGQNVPTSVKQVLASSYKPVGQGEGMFTVYQKK